MILRCLKLSLEKNHLHRFIKRASADLDKWYSSASYADEHGIDRESMGFNELISYVEASKKKLKSWIT